MTKRVIQTNETCPLFVKTSLDTEIKGQKKKRDSIIDFEHKKDFVVSPHYYLILNQVKNHPKDHENRGIPSN